MPQSKPTSRSESEPEHGPPDSILRGRCGREFTTLCNRLEGHKGLCSWEGTGDIPIVTRATGRSIPDLTKREHVCEYQQPVRPVDCEAGQAEAALRAARPKSPAEENKDTK